jgi:quercetin dioxygenase-like cupin family protein
MLSPALGTDDASVNAVFFEPGARLLAHRHTADQILYYVYGTGVVAIGGGEDVIVPAGHCVLLPADVVHMHGCTADGPALHLSIMRDPPAVHYDEVPEAWRKWYE